MGKLIDADKAIECMQYYHDDCAKTSEYTRLGFETAIEVVKDAPTVEAIPKDQYEARLKADMVAMLTEILLEIEELKLDYLIGECEHPVMKIKTTAYRTKTTAEIKHDCAELIQQKINSLKEGTDGDK